MSSHTRRNFIKRIVPVTAMIGFATGCRRLQVTDTDEFNRGAIDKLRVKLKGRLILPTDSKTSMKKLTTTFFPLSASN